MKSVGIKVLKNNLSRYIDLVRQGEVVLVTDRDEVVAELRRPSNPQVTRASEWEAFLEEQARRGGLTLAKRTHSTVERLAKPLVADVEMQALWDDERADRFF